MAYARGNIISAADYNTFIGGQSSRTPFPSEAAASGRLAGIWGVGYGQYGYNQNTTYPLDPVSPNQRITWREWTSLQQAVERCLLHQAQPLTNAPPTGYFDAGDRVLVHDGSPQAPGTWSLAISQADANRLSSPLTAPASYSLVGPLTLTYPDNTTTTRDVRTEPWGDRSAHPIDWPLSINLRVTWPTGDDARAFFNMGAELILRLRHPNGMTDHDQIWRYMFETHYGDLAYGRDYIDFRGNVTPNPVKFLSSPGYWNSPASETIFYEDTDILFHPTINVAPFQTGTLIRVFHRRYSAANVAGNGDNGNVIDFGWVFFPRPDVQPLAAGAYAEVYINAPIHLPDVPMPTQILVENALEPRPGY